MVGSVDAPIMLGLTIANPEIGLPYGSAEKSPVRIASDGTRPVKVMPNKSQHSRSHQVAQGQMPDADGTINTAHADRIRIDLIPKPVPATQASAVLHAPPTTKPAEGMDLLRDKEPGAITLTDDERERLPGLLFSRQLIDVVFRVCRDPAAVAAAAKKLTALRRDCETKARQLVL